MPERSVGRTENAGFTLIEMLVALAIFSLIMAALTGGVRLAGRAWATQERLIDRTDDLVPVQRLLRQLIASGRDFKGGAVSLTFVGTLPRSLAEPGLFDIELATAGDRLVLDWSRHVAGDTTASGLAEEMTETELARGVAGLDLSYFYPAAAEAPGEWREGMKKTDPPPALVKIALRLGTEEERHWPVLIVAPRIEPAVAQRL